MKPPALLPVHRLAATAPYPTLPIGNWRAPLCRELDHGSHTYLSRPSGTLAYLAPELLTQYRQSAAADLVGGVWNNSTTTDLHIGTLSSIAVPARVTPRSGSRCFPWVVKL